MDGAVGLEYSALPLAVTNDMRYAAPAGVWLAAGPEAAGTGTSAAQ
jgi:hypothetical protein